MTKREAAIVSAYTGILIGDFGEMHHYVEQLLGRPVWTHEMGSQKLADKIRDLAKADFLGIEITS